MKKKIFTFILCAVMVTSFVGCSSPTTSENTAKPETTKSEATEPETTEQETIEKDLPDGDYSEIGSGTMYISTSGGTSENGNIPVIFADSDAALIQIEVDTESFDGSKLSFVYIDGMLGSKEQLADSQQSLDLTGNALLTGVHKIEVVQYSTDDPSGEMITYKTASYEIKEK